MTVFLVLLTDKLQNQWAKEFINCLKGSDTLKKVLFVIPTLGGGGAERVLVTLLNNLDKNKYDITLLSIFDGGVNKKYLNENVKYQSYFGKVFRGNIHLMKLASAERLYKLMIKDEYDAVVSYLEGPTTRIVSGCPFPNSRLLNWVHIEINDPKELLQSYRSLNELAKTYDKYHSTIFVSNTAKKAFESTFENIGGSKIVKYNTVDNKMIQAKSNEAVDDIKFSDEKVNLISVGRFTEQKGYERLLRIIQVLVKENFNIHLYLLGKGELENKYYEIINELDLHKYVTILGFKDNPYKYVKNCDLFVCSSFREGYSTAVTESLILGTPVVTTLCSGMEEILGYDNEYGLITDNNDAALYDGIKKLLTESNLIEHYRKKAIERGKVFSTEKTVMAVEDLLDNL